jgi:UDPglucose 6-dehydrogenase
VAFSPEFLREGHAVEDTLTPDRIVVGSEDPLALRALRTLYAPILKTGSRLIETDPRSAELSKLSSNAFLALKISFANALARLAEATDADVSDVTEIMGTDARIGEAFLGAGIGFGGYCLPKDVAALERVAGLAGYDFPLLREVARLNDEALESVARLVEDAVWTLEGKRIALMGVAFKAGTDDVRGSPSIALAEKLTMLGATIAAYDPLVRELPSGIAGPPLFDDAYEAAKGAACIVIATADPRFAGLDYSRIKSEMASANLVDACNALQRSAIEAAGFVYRRVGVGRSRQ